MFKFRPWGFWLVLWQWPLFSKGPRYKLKLLYFKRGGAISLQRHFLRSECWRFLHGYGVFGFDLTLDTRIALKALYVPFYIPAEKWHVYRAVEPTLVLETQRGICQETDIERAP